MPPPGLKLSRVVLDVTDLARAAKFWGKALGYKTVHKSPEFWSMRHPTNKQACRIGFQPAEGAKPAINALHFELFTTNMEREAKRLEKLGATRAKDWAYYGDDVNWIVMRDPDGHEFCVVQVD